MKIKIGLFVMLFLSLVPGYSQYGFDFTCVDDTIKIALDTTTSVMFLFYLENTGAMTDSYAFDCRVVDSVAGWDEAFCVGAQCGTPGMILYACLDSGESESHIDVQVFLNANYGIEVLNLKVSSVGDPDLSDSINIYVKKESNIDEGNGTAVPGQDLIRLETYPNPFGEFLNIHISQGDRGLPVSLCIYDETGRRVRDLSNLVPMQGSKVIMWDGKDNLRRRVDRGIYFCLLEIGDRTIVKKQVYLP